MDIGTAKDEIFSALDAMAKTLRNGEDNVEIRYLERLLADRDELLTLAHFTMGIPVLEMADRTGIPWPQLYDVVDRVRAEKLERARKSGPFGGVWAGPSTLTPTEDDTEGEQP